jgi:hypothetical protein
MVSVFSPVREMFPEEYRRVTEVTYLGTVTRGLPRRSLSFCRTNTDNRSVPILQGKENSADSAQGLEYYAWTGKRL